MVKKAIIMNRSSLRESEVIESIRDKAFEMLHSLENDDSDTINSQSESGPPETKKNTHNSWIRGKTEILVDDSDSSSQYPSLRCKYFDKHGFLLMKSFCNDAEIKNMKNQMETLVDEKWDPNNEKNNNDIHHHDDEQKKKVTVFRTDEKQVDNQGSDDYFLESANKVHFFAEHQAINEEDGTLKDEFINDKMKALNKAGHGMHMIPGHFYNYTTSDKINTLVTDLGWTDPIVPQSMYIFKQAHVGGEVTSHQDSTFLYTTPKQSCLGLWLALDDATLENGCLWVRPGSHREKVRRIFGRNPLHFGNDAIKCRSNIAKGDLSASQMIFTEEPDSKHIPWDGKIPGSDDRSAENDQVDDEKKTAPWDYLFDAGFIPIECKAGDLLAFPGELDHLSLPNRSNHQRHTFQLHLVEGEGAGVEWSENNWLQYPKGVPFLRLNDV
jgi:phytanoyl-CoA hydroxylase